MGDYLVKQNARGWSGLAEDPNRRNTLTPKINERSETPAVENRKDAALLLEVKNTISSDLTEQTGNLEVSSITSAYSSHLIESVV
jgi:hypothetical protein